MGSACGLWRNGHRVLARRRPPLAASWQDLRAAWTLWPTGMRGTTRTMIRCGTMTVTRCGIMTRCGTV